MPTRAQAKAPSGLKGRRVLRSPAAVRRSKPERQGDHIRGLLIRPTAAQESALDAQYRYEYVLFGGAAGPGKSYILRWAAVEFLLWLAGRGVRNARVGLFSEDYPALKDRHITRFETGLVNRSGLPFDEAAARGLLEPEFPPWLGEVRETKADGLGYFLPQEYGGGVIALRNLDQPEKYASTEFAAIYVDELTKNPRQTFDALRFRKRWPGVEHSPFLAASNPGSIGHGWVKKLWIDRDFSGIDEYIDPQSVHFIPARAGDNPHLPNSYRATLQSLPENMRRAMLEGDWDVFEGMVFDEWRRDLHVCAPFPIPRGWRRWVAIDYGYANPFCALWFAASPEGRIYVYRELYEKGWRAREQARRILALNEPGEEIHIYGCDPSMFRVRHETVGTSIAQEYAEEGVRLYPANNDRNAGWARIHEALSWKRLPPGPDGAEGRLIKPPRLQIFDTCANLIRTLPALPYDIYKTEDVDTNAEDHAADALRYGLMIERGAHPIRPPNLKLPVIYATPL